jgi:hypothetical protein
MIRGPIIIIINTFLTHLHALLFSASFKFRIQKHIYFLAYNYKTQNTFDASYLLYCIVIYFICIIIFYFTHVYTLCLTTTRWSWGHKTRKLFFMLLEEERREISRLFPESSILNPEFPCGENLLLLQHSELEVPVSWHLCLVLSRLFSGGVAGEQRKTFTTAIVIE